MLEKSAGALAFYYFFCYNIRRRSGEEARPIHLARSQFSRSSPDQSCMTINDFIEKRPYLIWYTKNFKNLSQEAIVESVLNYGDFDDVKKMISILGIKKTAAIFRKQIKRKRINYDPKIVNYFKLYFNKYA